MNKLVLSAIASLLFSACSTVAPLGDPRPVQRVDVAVHVQPRISWVPETKGNGVSTGGEATAALVGGCLRTVFLAPFCLPFAVPLAIVVETAVYGVRVAMRPRAQPPSDVEKRARVHVVDLQELVEGFGLETEVLSVMRRGEWRIVSAGSTAGSETTDSVQPERALRLEVRFDEIKAFESPIDELRVTEIHLTWRLVDPLRNQLIDGGGLMKERRLKFSLRFDEEAKQWATVDDGRYAEGWEAARRDITSGLANRVVPLILAYGRDTPR